MASATISQAVQSTAALVVLMMGASLYAAPTVVSIQGPDVTDDAALSVASPDTNAGAGGNYQLRNDFFVASGWAIVKFDLPILAAGESITDATMTFQYFENHTSTPGSIEVMTCWPAPRNLIQLL